MIRAFKLLMIAILLILFTPTVYGECDTSPYGEEYGAGKSYNYVSFNHDTQPYTVIKYDNDFFLVVDTESCSLNLDMGLNNEVIKDYLFFTNPQKSEYYTTYSTLKECHKVAPIADKISGTISKLKKAVGIVTNPVVEKAEMELPSIASKLAPHGWEVEAKGTTKILVKITVKGAKKLVRNNWAVGLTEFSSNAVAGSIIGNIYDYSVVLQGGVGEMNNGEFYSNSVAVVGSLNDELTYYFSPEVQKKDNVVAINNFLMGQYKAECKGLSEGKIYQDLLSAQAELNEIANRGDVFSENSLRVLQELEGAASGSISKAETLVKKTNFFFTVKLWAKGAAYGYETEDVRSEISRAGELLKQSKYEHERGLFISAEEHADVARTLSENAIVFEESMEMKRFGFIRGLF